MHAGQTHPFPLRAAGGVAAGLARARRRHFRRRPLGRPRRRDQLRRGRRGGRLRPWLGLRGRAEPGGDQRPCRRPGAAGGRRAAPSRSASCRRRARRRAAPASSPIDPARDLALLEVEDIQLPPIPLYVGPLDDGVPIAALGLSRQCRSRHRPLGRRLYPAAAADPLGRHLLQRPADQRHHHPAPHRQYRPRPFGRALARPVRPGARRQHA